MNDLHLLRLQLDGPRLMRFAASQHGLARDDEGSGYALHVWLAAMFGEHAPKPFRFFERDCELLGYARADAETLLEHAHAFAPAHAFASLTPDSIATKAMPASWREGQRLQIDVLACPVSRKDDTEKDVFLRALDRQGDAAPPRPEVYTDWFRRQCGASIEFDQLQLTGFSRRRLLRRPSIAGQRKPLSIERPQATFRAIARIVDAKAFSTILARGIGRHRAFGFGMVLLKPAP
jgi:CRISPR system Cascade subunit CasE